LVPKIFSVLDSLAKPFFPCTRKEKMMLNEWRLMNGNFFNGSSHLKAKFCHAPVDFVSN